jgi:hypothetical protein
MTSKNSDRRVFRWIRAKTEELFGVDLRSLALFRMALALIALADLSMRAGSLIPFYTDRGVLPRQVLLTELSSSWRLSLLLISGDVAVQAVLLTLAGAAALALLVGFRTRSATIFLWVFFVSLHVRNPLVLSNADTLMRLLFFWAMFLPLGACWSVDRTRTPDQRPLSTRFLSFATVGLFAQIAFIYAFGAIFKSGAEWRSDYTAIYYALQLDSMVTPFGEYLRQFPELLALMTFGTYWFEALGILLLFSPVFTGPLRTAGVLGYVLLHVGIRMTMTLGLFQWIAALAMVCFLPAWFWAKAPAFNPTRASRSGYGSGQVWLNAWMARLQRSIPGVLRLAPMMPLQTPSTVSAARSEDLPIVKAQSHSAEFSPGGEPPEPGRKLDVDNPVRLRSPIWANLLAASFLAYIFAFNLSTISTFRVPPPLVPVGGLLRLEQKWNMFSPYPNKVDGWFVIPGELRNGKQVELSAVTLGDFSVQEGVSWEKPRRVADTFKDLHWRKYMVNLLPSENEELRRYFGRYVCREWDARHDQGEEVQSLQLHYMMEPTLPNYQAAEPSRKLLWNHRCT